MELGWAGLGEARLGGAAVPSNEQQEKSAADHQFALRRFAKASPLSPSPSLSCLARSTLAISASCSGTPSELSE